MTHNETPRRENQPATRDMYAVNDEGKSAYELRREAYAKRHANDANPLKTSEDVLAKAAALGAQFEKGIIKVENVSVANNKAPENNRRRGKKAKTDNTTVFFALLEDVSGKMLGK